MSMPALAQSVISCVNLICERLGFVEPPEVIDAVFNLRRACNTATQLETSLSPTVCIYIIITLVHTNNTYRSHCQMMMIHGLLFLMETMWLKIIM